MATAAQVFAGALNRGAAYVLKSGPNAQPQLYVALTNAKNANSLRDLRGPSFTMPASSSFRPLEKGYEPTAAEIAEVVDAFYDSGASGTIRGMGEEDGGLVFAGDGEPLLREKVLLQSVRLIKEKRHGVQTRITTNGLFPPGVAADLGEAGVNRVTIQLMSADPQQYQRLLEPEDGKGLGVVCAFIEKLVEVGVEVEVTAVQRPEVNIGDVRALAMALGAVSFRARSFHP